MEDSSRIKRATLIGASTILTFASLGVFSVLSDGIPPFQMVAISLTIAFIIGLIFPFTQGRNLSGVFSQPLKVWALGVYGLFGYHFAYFVAVKNAPPVDANLINYLWPLLIVLFSSLLPREKSRWYHFVGAGLGFCGTAALILGGDVSQLGSGSILGYGAALAAAFLWSSYSVASRCVGHVPTDAVGGFCGAAAILAAVCHVFIETTVIPDSMQALGLLGLGLGPVGLAFFTWDYGVKHGDIRVLGTLAYAIPLLSTALMITFGMGDFSVRIALACLLIILGACVATLEFWTQRVVHPSIGQDDAA